MAKGLVVDLCPGTSPFPYGGAVRCGWGADGTDISRDRLPFGDQEVDFLYCRHTLEDLLDPAWALQEIRRVAKSGWIETPSAAAELCRGVDGARPPWRGYMHHRSLFWVEGKTLMTCAKYSMAEHMTMPNIDLASRLKVDVNWNCAYAFRAGECRWKQLRHEVDYALPNDYPKVLARALRIYAETPTQDTTPAPG
jgi:hypothetical protein